MVSMKDIAKACSVSVATVSKALSGQPDIGEQTRELICKTETLRTYEPKPTAARDRAYRDFQNILR